MQLPWVPTIPNLGPSDQIRATTPPRKVFMLRKAAAHDPHRKRRSCFRFGREMWTKHARDRVMALDIESQE